MIINFEGFDISLNQKGDTYIASISGNHVSMSTTGQSYQKVIKNAKLKCLQWLADTLKQSVLIADQDGIVYRNYPLQESEITDLQPYQLTEGIVSTQAKHNKKPVNLTISVIDYGGLLFCKIESIHARSLDTIPV